MSTQEVAVCCIKRWHGDHLATSAVLLAIIRRAMFKQVYRYLAAKICPAFLVTSTRPVLTCVGEVVVVVVLVAVGRLPRQSLQLGRPLLQVALLVAVHLL